jgi:hypothetical protein
LLFGQDPAIDRLDSSYELLLIWAEGLIRLLSAVSFSICFESTLTKLSPEILRQRLRKPLLIFSIEPAKDPRSFCVFSLS